MYVGYMASTVVFHTRINFKNSEKSVLGSETETDCTTVEERERILDSEHKKKGNQKFQIFPTGTINRKSVAITIAL